MSGIQFSGMGQFSLSRPSKVRMGINQQANKRSFRDKKGKKELLYNRATYSLSIWLLESMNLSNYIKALSCKPCYLLSYYCHFYTLVPGSRSKSYFFPFSTAYQLLIYACFLYFWRESMQSIKKVQNYFTKHFQSIFFCSLFLLWLDAFPFLCCQYSHMHILHSVTTMRFVIIWVHYSIPCHLDMIFECFYKKGLE